jgi:integrase/recombinase XerD
VKNTVSGTLTKASDPQSVSIHMVKRYAQEAGLLTAVPGVCAHSLRATAATNALNNGADIGKVPEGLGHAPISTTRIYDHRQQKPEEGPTFCVRS